MFTITESQVRATLSVQDALECTLQAFLDRGQGIIDHQPRRRVGQPGGILHTMSAASAALEKFAWKNYVTTRQGAQFYLGLHDLSGTLLAVIEADWLGRLRTGAATAIAARAALGSVTQPDAVLALVGCGKQAETQLLAMHAAGLIGRCQVTSRTPGRAQAFADSMQRLLEIPVVATSSVEQACDGAQSLITVTTAAKPILNQPLPKGLSFVAAVGSNWPERAELSPAQVAQADTVLCDDVEACQLEAGDLIQAAATGTWAWAGAQELSHCVRAGSGLAALGNLVLFKSVGVAFEDLYLAAKVYQRFKQAE